MGRNATAHLFFGYVVDDNDPEALYTAYAEASEHRRELYPFTLGTDAQQAPFAVYGMQEYVRVYAVMLRSTHRSKTWGPAPIELPSATSNLAAELNAAIAEAGLPQPPGEPAWHLGATYS